MADAPSLMHYGPNPSEKKVFSSSAGKFNMFTDNFKMASTITSSRIKDKVI